MSTFRQLGFKIQHDLISKELINEICAEIECVTQNTPAHGIRNADSKFPVIAKIARNPQILHYAQVLLGAKPQLVRAIFFDKTPEKNWLVTWHQDKTVAISNRFSDPDWGPWSLKDGCLHVQAPLAVLNQMITFRIHLDPADRHNGCLKIIPGSHQLGLLPQKEISLLVQQHKQVFCEVNRGDIVVMRPHILHASSKAEAPTHRRVVHLEYCSHQLPPGINWV